MIEDARLCDSHTFDCISALNKERGREIWESANKKSLSREGRGKAARLDSVSADAASSKAIPPLWCFLQLAAWT